MAGNWGERKWSGKVWWAGLEGKRKSTMKQWQLSQFVVCLFPLCMLLCTCLSLSHLLQGGASTINEMCLIFFFYYPRINISSCMGYPDIIYVTNELGEEASEWVSLTSKAHTCMGRDLVRGWANHTSPFSPCSIQCWFKKLWKQKLSLKVSVSDPWKSDPLS